MKLYQDRDWLYQKYIIENLTMAQIGKLCGVSYNPIWRYLKKFNIPRHRFGYYGQHRIYTEERNKKISNALRGRRSPMKGRHQTEHFKKILHDRMSGEKHPQYGKRGNETPNWKGGRSIDKGYVYIYDPNINARKKYTAEHRTIAAGVLGRPLKNNEVAHHINGNRQDNRKENLLICTKAYHGWLHKQIQLQQKAAEIQEKIRAEVRS